MPALDFTIELDGVGEWRSGSAPALGAGGRGFDPRLPDHVAKSGASDGCAGAVDRFLHFVDGACTQQADEAE